MDVPVLGYDPTVIRLSRKQTLGLLTLCGAGILYATMWPYNFDFRPEFTDQRMRIVNWVPFAGTAATAYKDAVLNTILFIPFGVLAYLYRSKEAVPRRSALVPALWGMMLSVSVETLQVWLPSRFPSATDVFTNTLGSLIGASATCVMVDSIGRTGPRQRKRREAPPPLLMAAVSCPLPPADPVRVPLPFRLPRGQLPPGIRRADPVYYHVTHPDYASVYVILRPVVAWLPAGIVYAGFRYMTGKVASPLRIALLAASAQLLIETGRAFTEYRHPDVTNLLLAGLGATAGIYLYHRALAFPTSA